MRLFPVLVLFLFTVPASAETVLHCTVAKVDGDGVPAGWPVACREAQDGTPLTPGYDRIFTPGQIAARQAELQARKDELFPERPALPPLNREQLLLGLLDLGVTEEQVFAAIRQIADVKEREVARIRFQESPDYHRDDPLLVMLAQAFGMASGDIDRVWQARAAAR